MRRPEATTFPAWLPRLSGFLRRCAFMKRTKQSIHYARAKIASLKTSAACLGSQRRKGPLPLLLIGVTLLQFSSHLFAKEVMLRWEPLKHVGKYELVVRHQGQDVATETLPGERTSWQANLAFGFYTYHLRAIDFTGRPGEWTPLFPLVVMPPAPAKETPAESSIIALVSPRETIPLRWSASEGADRYLVEVKNSKGKQLIAKTVEGIETSINGLEAGNYSWTVQPVVSAPKTRPKDAASGSKSESETETKDDLPPELSGKSWTGDEGTWASFQLRYIKPAAPELISPLGIVPYLPYPEGKPQLFEWKEVPKAQAYEIRIGQKSRGLDGDKITHQNFVSTSPSLSVPGLPPGKYLWAVRALINLDEKQKPEVVGEWGKGTFTLSQTATPYRRTLVNFSLGPSPYGYSSTSPNGNLVVPGSPLSFVLAVEGEYHFLRTFSAIAAIRHIAWDLGTTGMGRTELSLKLTRSFNIDTASRSTGLGWKLIPEVGLSYRGEAEAAPPSAINTATPQVAASSPSVALIGPTLGLDLRRDVTSALSLDVKFDYLFPMTTGGTYGGAKYTPRVSYQNWELGVYGKYWFNSHFAATLSLAHENNAVSFDSSGTFHQVQMNQFFMLAGFALGWGN